MSTLSHDSTGKISSQLVAMQRGMTEEEAYRFLASGELPPDPSVLPSEDFGVMENAGDAQIMPLESAYALLSGVPTVVASASFDLTGLHGAILPSDEGFKFNPNQPRDPNTGRWIDVPGVGKIADVLTKSTKTTKANKNKKLKTTVAIFNKNIKHNDVIGVTGDDKRRARWDADKKKFIIDEQVDGEWKESETLTKSALYKKMQQESDQWFEPEEVSESAETGTKGTPSEPPQDTPETPSVPEPTVQKPTKAPEPETKAPEVPKQAAPPDSKTPEVPKQATSPEAEAPADTTYTGPRFEMPKDIDPEVVNEFTDLVRKQVSLEWPEKLTLEEQQRLTQLRDELSSQPRHVRMRIEQEAQILGSFDKFRKKHNLKGSVKELQDEMRNRVRKAFANKKIAVRVTPKNLENILDDGRFKSQFESKSSKGNYDPTFRAGMEASWFGIPDDPSYKPQERPIYGYVALDGIRPAGFGSGSIGDPATDALSQYGQIQVVLKYDVRNRTTAMFGDSLNNLTQGVPSPVNDPDWKSFTPIATGHGARGLARMDRSGLDADFRHNAYAEAQIHGGVSLDDVEEIVFPSNPPTALRQKLDEKGVKWRVLNFKTAANSTPEERETALRIAREDRDILQKEIADVEKKLPNADPYSKKQYEKDLKKLRTQLKQIEDALPVLEKGDTSSKKATATSKPKTSAKLTPEERAAAKKWTTSYFRKIQEALRDGGAHPPEVALLDSAIEKSPPKGPRTLYRAVLPDFMPDEFKTPGSIFYDPGFMATSTTHPKDTMFENYNHIIISTPDGAKMLDIGGVYDEVLLPRGSRLRIDKVEQNRTLPGTTVPLYDIHATLLTGDDGMPDKPKAADKEVNVPEPPRG